MEDIKKLDTMKTVKKKVDRHGNDLDHIKKIDKLAIKTQNHICSIHNRKFIEHSDDELMEDYNLAGLRYQKSQGHLYHTDEIQPNEITSLKEMTDIGLSNYDLQAGVAASTRKDFNSFLDLNGYLTSIIMETLKELMNKPVPEKLKLISILAATKNSRLLSNCTNLTCDGYYESAMTLLRPAMENYLLLVYLRDHKEIVDEFYDGKITLKSRDLINYSRKRNQEFGSLWGILCDNYIHSNIVSLHTITQSTDDPESSIVHMLPFYDEENAKTNLIYSTFFKLLTLTTLARMFVDELKDGKSLLQNIIVFGKVFIELYKNPKLQIEYTHGDKSNF